MAEIEVSFTKDKTILLIEYLNFQNLAFFENAFSFYHNIETNETIMFARDLLILIVIPSIYIFPVYSTYFCSVILF